MCLENSPAVIGPTLFGLVAQATGVSRYGILPVLGMFILRQG